MVWLSIAGELVRVRAMEPVLDAVRARFGAFTSNASPESDCAPVTLEVRERRGAFAPVFERPAPASCAVEGDEIALTGAVRGSYHVVRREGFVEDVTGLGPVDALMRLALSIALPEGGALLLHGAAIERRPGRALALCGDTGAGKSTAAEAFGGCCDELVVLRPDSEGTELLATPYWRGRPVRARCDAVVCLERGGVPGSRGLRGPAAVRAVARHTVRYVARGDVDEAILAALCRLRTEVIALRCPEGSAYLPFLGEQLGLERAAAS